MQIVDHIETRLVGTPISAGIAIGPMIVCKLSDEVIFERSIGVHDVEKELQRYREALAKGKNDLEKLQVLLEQSQMKEGATIIEAHLQLLEDPVITKDIEEEIRTLQTNAEFVLHETIQKYKRKFNSIPDNFFRERFCDLQSIIYKILDCLKGELKSTYIQPKNGIIYTRELSVVDLTEASICQAQAFITQMNGTTSHAAIAAKAKGMPFVTSISYSEIEPSIKLESIVVIDGYTGDVIINPSEGTLQHYHQKLKSLNSTKPISFANCQNNLPAETIDGYQVRLSANIEMAGEVSSLHQHSVSGVGLFRSEYAFLTNTYFPSEEEQFTIYKEAVENMKGLPIVIRVFDLGGDKYLLGQKIPFENNPFLGCRAIRLLLKEKELFKTQLKAILRASNFGDVSLMLPMISSVEEIRETKEILQQAKIQIETEHEILIKGVRIGCMIEVPSAALIVDILAKECDFFSIGTNDLVQYALAVDRGNHSLSTLYTPSHPSVLRLIKLIVSEANVSNIPVSICGEVAANPKFTALLLGLGVHELSVSSRQIAETKEAIRQINLIEAVQLAEKALTLKTAQEVDELLENRPTPD